MRTDRFVEVLAVQEEMKEKKVADYVLVRLEETDNRKLSDVLSRMIRNVDVDIGDPASSSVPGSLSFDENEDFKKYDDDHAVGDLCAGFRVWLPCRS